LVSIPTTTPTGTISPVFPTSPRAWLQPIIRLPGVNNIDGILSIPAANNVLGITIADQLAIAGKTWKSYQESLPPQGADLVNYADGFYSNLTNFANIKPVLTPPLSPNDVVFLYAVKHNPFAYFRSIQEANEPGSDLTNIVGFDGAKGLYAGLAAGSVPTFSFIAPNQCNDQHGRGNAGPYCNFDPNDDGTQAGLNPALLQRGDVAVKQIVTGTKTTTAFRLPSTRS
jgi:phosphatidylinositol-3-phosphatase